MFKLASSPINTCATSYQYNSKSTVKNYLHTMDQPIKAGEVVPLKLEFRNAKGQAQTLTVNAKASFKDPYKR